MDRELSGCMSIRQRWTTEFQLMGRTPVQENELVAFSAEKNLSRGLADGHLTFAKPYHWLSLSESIEFNHGIDNLRFIALCAQKPLKDRVYKRYHNMQSIQEMIQNQLNEQPANLQEPQSLELGELQPVSNQGESVQIDESLVFRESMSQLLSLATQNKANSMVLQSLAGNCSAECAAKLSLLVRYHHRKLICDRYGSYLVQAMVKRDPEVERVVEETSTQEFTSMVHNEYSSRVMQRLIEISDTFRTFVMESFKKHMGIFIQSVSACYLISVGILNSQSESERDVVSEYLSKRSISWTANKYFKKILICYLSACSEEKLNYMHRKLLKKRSALWYLTEKFACLILLKFVERNHAPTKRLLLNKIKKDPVGVSRLSYFGYFAGETVKLDAVHGMAAGLHAVLTASLSAAQHRSLLQEPLVYQIYCGAVSVTCPRRQAEPRAAQPRQMDAARTNGLP